MLDLFATASVVQGLVPGSNSVGATFFLNGSGAWSVPAGGGDVAWNAGTAPANNALVRFDGTTGQLIQESEIIVDDSDNVSGMGTLNGKTIADLTSDTDTGSTGWTWVDGTTTLGTSDTVLPTQNAVKVYVDTEVAAAVASEMTYKGGYNATTDTPTLDTGTPTLAVGDMYVVTTGGTFFALAVVPGDTLIANTASVDAADFADWDIVEGLQTVPDATESEKGVIEIATQAEVDTLTGGSAVLVVTPAYMHLTTFDGGTF
jgi:hypothetical protein